MPRGYYKDGTPIQKGKGFFKKGDNTIQKKSRMTKYTLNERENVRFHKLIGTYLHLLEIKNMSQFQSEHLKKIEKACLKFLDKLHANKLDMKLDANKPFLILRDVPEENGDANK